MKIKFAAIIIFFAALPLISQSSGKCLENGKNLFFKAEYLNYSDSLDTYKALNAAKREIYKAAVDTLKRAARLSPDDAEAFYFLGYALDRFYNSYSPGSSLLETRAENTLEISRQFERVLQISKQYEGEIIIVGPRSKLTGVWGSLAIALAHKGEIDSAKWAFREGKKRGGFADHALELCRNILKYCGENAILLVNGDNDTFPMWYLQLMENYRRDATIVNASLLNTLWYIDQLKNKPLWGSPAVKFSIEDRLLRQPDDENADFNYEIMPPHENTIQVASASAFIPTGQTAPAVEPKSEIVYLATGDVFEDGKNAFMRSYLATADLLEQNAFERPVYFSTTVAQDVYKDWERFLVLEGMAYKMYPFEAENADRLAPAVNFPMMKQILLNEKTPKGERVFPPLQLIAIAKPEFFADAEAPGVADNYRGVYLDFVSFSLEAQGDTAAAVAALDKLEKVMPKKQYPLDFRRAYAISFHYSIAGNDEKAVENAEYALEACLEAIENSSATDPDVEYEMIGRYGAYRFGALCSETLGDFESAANLLEELLDLTENAEKEFRELGLNDSQNQVYSMIQSNIADLKKSIVEYQIATVSNDENPEETLELARDLLEEYKNSDDEIKKGAIPFLEKRIKELESMK